VQCVCIPSANLSLNFLEIDVVSHISDYFSGLWYGHPTFVFFFSINCIKNAACNLYSDAIACFLFELKKQLLFFDWYESMKLHTS